MVSASSKCCPLQTLSLAPWIINKKPAFVATDKPPVQLRVTSEGAEDLPGSLQSPCLLGQSEVMRDPASRTLLHPEGFGHCLMHGTMQNPNLVCQSCHQNVKIQCYCSLNVVEDVGSQDRGSATAGKVINTLISSLELAIPASD